MIRIGELTKFSVGNDAKKLKITVMKNQNNINVFNKWVDRHIAHDVDVMLDLLTDDISLSTAAGSKFPPATNKEEAGQTWRALFDAFSDLKLEVISVVSDDDVLFAEVFHGGTMDGRMMDMEPTGKSYKVEAAFRFEFENGKIKSIRSYWDSGSMMKQLGLVPEMLEAH